MKIRHDSPYSTNSNSDSNSSPDTPTGGTKRAATDGATNAAKRQRPNDPVSLELLTGWLSALPQLSEPIKTRVEAFLGFVALGVEFPYEENIEQEVYNDLIRADAYVVFEEVFRAFNQIHWSNAPEEHRPAPFLLILQLPYDWVPASPQRMIDTFREVPVRRLVLFPQRSEGETTYALPDAVHDCLLALLESDDTPLRELVINGVMDTPDGVADALGESQLQSIEFGWMEKEPPDEEEMTHYTTLAKGLGTCGTLAHIQIAHPAFFALHAVIDEFPSPGPKLSSVGFDMDHPIKVSDPAQSSQVEAFMWTVREFPTLTSVTAHASVANGESLNDVFIAPLTHHTGLKQLDILGHGELPTDPVTLKALPMVAALSVSCPTLTRFVWEAGEQPLEAGDNMRAFKRIGGDLAMEGPSAELAQSMAAPTFQLGHLVLNGQTLATGILNTFFKMLRSNTTLYYLNLDRCHTDIRSALLLPDLLKTNTTLKTVQLSQNYDDYYFVASDGNVHGFLQNHLESDYDTDADDPKGFTLTFGEGVTDAERALALSEFAELEYEANQLFATLDARNARGRMDMALASTRSPNG